MMRLSNIIRLYKFIKEGDSESLKEYSKSMTPDQVNGLRIHSSLPFTALSWIAKFALRNKIPPKGAPIPKQHLKFYKEKPFESYTNYFLKVVKNQDNWDTLKILDKREDATFLTVIRKKSENYRLGDFEDALQWNTYYLAGILKSLPYYNGEEKKLLIEHSKKLIKGISECVTDKAIKRHPLKSIHYELEPISQDMLSGFIQLFLTTETEENKALFPELYIDLKDRFVKVIKRADYHLMYPNGDVNSYDLHPNVVYNHIKSFVYTGLRMITGEYNNRDRKIAKSMLRVMPYTSKEPQDRSMYGTVVALNALEGIALNDRQLLLDAIEWTEYTINSSYELNAEFLSIAASLYRKQGYKTKKEQHVTKTLKSLSGFIDIGVEKPGKMRPDLIPGKHPRPVQLRNADDWFWQRKAYRTGDLSDRCNMIEYINAYSRLLPDTYYPKENK